MIDHKQSLAAGLLVALCIAAGAPAGMLNEGFALRQDLYRTVPEKSPGSSHAASLVELPGGEILYSFNADHFEGPIVRTRWGDRSPNRAFLSRLYPGTESWTEPVVLARKDSVEIHNTILWYDQDLLYMFYTTMEGLGHEDSTLDVMTSTDGGRTWSEPRLMRREWGWMFGTNPIRMSNGEVLLPVYREQSPGGVGFMISTDGFRTWEVHPSDPAGWPRPGIMAAVVELAPGELLGYLRHSRQIMAIRSSDFGRTWSSPEPTGMPNPWSRLALIRLQNGNLLMAHNPTSSAPRTPLRLSLSEDNGETWPYRVDVETDPQGRHDYPYLIQASDGRIHLGYSHNGKKNMRHVMFDEAFVRSGKSIISDTTFSMARFEQGRLTITHR